MTHSTSNSGGTPPRRHGPNTVIMHDDSDRAPWQMRDVDYDKPQRRPASSEGTRKKGKKKRRLVGSVPKGPTYTREYTQTQWNRLQALRDGTPALERPSHRRVTPPSVDSVAPTGRDTLPLTPEAAAEKSKVLEWLGSQNKLWASFIENVSHPHSLTHMAEALWEKKYHSPVPDEFILVVQKHSHRGGYVVRALAVFDPKEKTFGELNKKFPGYAVLSVLRDSDSNLSLVRPIAGASAAEVLEAALRGREEALISHVAERRFSVRAAGGKINRTNDILLWHDFLKYLTSIAPALIPTLSDIQSTVNTDAELLPSRVALTVRKSGGHTTALTLMSWEDAKNLPDAYSVVFFEAVTTLRYVMPRMRGAYTMEIVEAVLIGLGIFPEKPLEIEKLLVTGIMRDGAYTDFKSQLWGDYLDYVGGLGHGLWARMLELYKATHAPDPESGEYPSTLWMIAHRVPIKHGYHLQRFIVADHDTGGDLAAIQISPFEKGTVISSIGGTGALDVGIAWLAKVGLKIDGPIERAVAAGTWNYVNAKCPDKDQVPTWGRWRSYVKSRGTQGTFQRMRQIYEYVHMIEKSPDDLIVMGKRQGSGDLAPVRIFKVVTVEEGAHYFKKENVMKLHIRRQPDGQESLVRAWGMGGKETAELLGVADAENVSGGITLAPVIDEDLAQSLRPKPEIFVSDDVKAPALTTPAEPMPTPQLERPADAVDLPAMGGYQITDTEIIKNFATPPSVGRLHAPKNTAMLLLDFLAVGVAVAVFRLIPISQAAFASGDVYLTPRDRRRTEGI